MRGPIGYIGYGWESGDEMWNNSFLMQPGSPVGNCVEVTPGVFSREWSEGTAVLDCNTFEAKLPFPSL